MENYGKIDNLTGMNFRFMDFLNSFDELIVKAKNINPDLIVFAGDAYRDRNPTPTHQREAALRFKKLALIAPTILVVGNHDLPQALEKANTLDIFSALEVENIIVFRRPTLKVIQSKSGSVQVLALPWITKSKLLEKDQFLGKSADETQILLAQKLNQITKKFIDKINPKIPAVAVVHATCENATFGSERSVMLGTDLILSEKSFISPKIQYVGLGHIHKFQVLRENPPIIYAGSIDRIDFGEEKDAKGFVVADIEVGKKTEYKFIKLSVRPFKTINLKLDYFDDSLEKTIKKQIGHANFKNTVVRVKVKMPADLIGQVNEHLIRKYLNDAFHIVSITFETPQTRKIKQTVFLEQGETPLKTLIHYLEINKVSSKKREQLIKYAKDLIEERE